jgi:hypothetical protein
MTDDLPLAGASEEKKMKEFLALYDQFEVKISVAGDIIEELWNNEYEYAGRYEICGDQIEIEMYLPGRMGGQDETMQARFPLRWLWLPPKLLRAKLTEAHEYDTKLAWEAYRGRARAAEESTEAKERAELKRLFEKYSPLWGQHP